MIYSEARRPEILISAACPNPFFQELIFRLAEDPPPVFFLYADILTLFVFFPSLKLSNNPQAFLSATVICDGEREYTPERKKCQEEFLLFSSFF